MNVRVIPHGHSLFLFCFSRFSELSESVSLLREEMMTGHDDSDDMMKTILIPIGVILELELRFLTCVTVRRGKMKIFRHPLPKQPEKQISFRWKKKGVQQIINN